MSYYFAKKKKFILESYTSLKCDDLLSHHHIYEWMYVPICDDTQL
jgi:hypothetical protein